VRCEECYKSYIGKIKSVNDYQIEIKMKEELWDNYIYHEFTKGLKNPHCHYIQKPPKDVFQFIRASMRLKNLIDGIKKGTIKTRAQIRHEKEIEAKAKLNGILVNCQKHGALKLKDVIKGGKSRWTGEQRYKCRQCMSDTHRNYYERRKDHVLEKCAKYRKEHPEKRKQIKAKSWKKHHGKNKEYDSIEGKSIKSD
jgi:hypothetical protein